MLNVFYCANEKFCNFHTTQSMSNMGQELGEYKLCKDCVSRGFYLKEGVVVARKEVKSHAHTRTLQ
jgi:hypothetical protein